MKTGSFAFVFSCISAALCIAALATGFSAASSARKSRAALAAFRSENAALLEPAMREEEAWRLAVAAFPVRSGNRPALFSSPSRSDARFVPAVSATLHEETFEIPSVALSALSSALDSAVSAGFRPVAISVDALSSGRSDPQVKASVTLLSLSSSQSR